MSAAGPMKSFLQDRCSECGRKKPAPRKASDKKKARRARVRARKAAKSEKHRMSIKEIRAACVKRADGICECGCGRSFYLWGAQMDHWHQGSAKRLDESVETCWMLTWKCHAMRQANLPTILFWNIRFAAHCEKHNLAFKPHVVHALLERRRPPKAVSGGS